MAVAGNVQLIPGTSRVAGTRYAQAPVAGDWWYEVVDGRSLTGGEVPLAGDPTTFVRLTPPGFPFQPGAPVLAASGIAAGSGFDGFFFPPLLS